MSLRPRYSLLTLLVLTALVAGGVKLWRGPHHVVEPEFPYAEVEYTFTRDWRGNRIIEGVRVNRSEQPLGTPERVMLEYYRAGLNLNLRRSIVLDAAAKTYQRAYDSHNGETCDRTPQEQTEFDQAVEKEYQHWQTRGYTLKPYEVSN